MGLSNLSIISVVGVSHHTCPVEVRERFAFTAGNPCAGLEEHPDESVWLSTCNRTELYSVADEVDVAAATFADTLQIPGDLAGQYSYALEAEAAAHHLFRVASGLDSAVVGEHEILGQVRRSLSAAQEQGSAGPMLTRMFQDALAVGKRVRSETALGGSPVSVGGAAASILRQRLGGENLEHASILVIGAGEMARSVARSLIGLNAGVLAIGNRTHARALEVAADTGGEVVEWPIAPERLARFDAIISCTSASGFLLTRETMEAVTSHLPAGKSIQLVDLAVPRDIDPDVASIPAIALSNIDDARTVVDDSLSRRAEHIEPAERIIEEQLDGFREWLAARDVADTIRLLKERADLIRRGELEWALPKLPGLSPSERQVVERFSARLVNKLLHTLTVRLRETASGEGADCLGEHVLQVFDLDDTQDAGDDPTRASNGPRS